MRVYAASGRALRLHDVACGDTRYLPALLRLMVEFFPHCEKFVPSLEENALLDVTPESPVVPHQWVIDVDGETAGFYIFDYRPPRDCGLSLFMGLYPEFRPLAAAGYDRLAHFLFVDSVRQANEDATRFQRKTPPGLAAEIELPALRERYRFYNFVELPVVYYEPMFPDPAIAMTDAVDPQAVTYERVTLGLFHGEAPRLTLTAAEVANLALAYLEDFYRLPPDVMPVQQALATAEPFDWTEGD